MDYQSMSARELQDELARRELPSGRAAKAALVQRLVEDDAAKDGATPPPASEVKAAPEPEGETLAVLADGEHVLQPAGVPHIAVPTPATVRCTFPAGPEGPGEEEHLAYRQTTIQTAIEQGLSPIGDAYRTGTVDGLEVYEVAVQAVT